MATLHRHPQMIVGFVGVWAVLVCGANADDSEYLARYFRELRDRRLFSLAEGYCLERLANDELPQDERTTYVLELSRTLAQHAKFSVGAEQTALWKQAEVVIDDLLTQQPEHPKRLLLSVQRAFIAASRGEHLRWQAELFPEDDAQLKAAVQSLSESARTLAAMQRTLSQQVSGRTERDKGISQFELRRLEQNTRYRLCTVLLDQAKLLPPRNPDRIGGLIDAEQFLRQLSGGVISEALTLNSRLLYAECFRLQGETGKARTSIKKLQGEKLPPAFDERIAAESARLFLDDGKPLEANRELIEFYDRYKVLSGESYYLKTQILAKLWEQSLAANEADLADAWWKQLQAHTAECEKLVGGYWGQRCKYQLDFVVEARKYGPELARTIRAAKNAFAADKTDRAIEKYGEAAQAAMTLGRSKFATELAFTRASILLQASRFEEAGREFRHIFDRFPTSEEAPRSHLLAAYCLGKRYDADQTTENREAYSSALEQHRELFPNESTAGEAAWMLARLEERRRQTTKALTYYLAVPADHRRGPDAQVSSARCYEHILNRLVELNRSTTQWRADAKTRLGAVATRMPNEPDNVTDSQAEFLVRLARIHLGDERPNYAVVDGLLSRVVGTFGRIRKAKEFAGTDLETRWLLLMQSANPLRVVSLAGQGHQREAQALVQTLADSSTKEVFDVLDGLELASQNSPDVIRRKIGEVRLDAVQSLQSRTNKLSAAERLRLQRCHADALLATSQPKAAVRVYESLLDASPRDRKLMRQVAELLATINTPDAWKKSRDLWRKLESFEKSGSRPWLEIRWEVARASFEAGDVDSAKKAVKLTMVLYSDLGGDDLKAKYEKLKTRIEGR